MVGRDAELKNLQQLFQETAQTGRARAVTLVADAGIGKSRLLYEFEHWLDQSSTPLVLFKGRAGEDRAIRRLLRNLLPAGSIFRQRFRHAAREI
jgi:predicted ATPase